MWVRVDDDDDELYVLLNEVNLLMIHICMLRNVDMEELECVRNLVIMDHANLLTFQQRLNVHSKVLHEY